MKLSILIILLFYKIIIAQTYETSIAVDTNWSGWEAIIIKNGLITTSTVPEIGARVMQYDFGESKIFYHNAALNGKTFTPSGTASTYNNFGGFKNWPSPQYGTGRWNWPPPPTLDYGKYTYEILTNTTDSSVIRVTSPVEQWKAPGLQFVRRMTIYKNSTRVKMEQTLINTGTTAVEWGIWDVSQCNGIHPGEKDYENFWIYFPINPNSVFPKKVKTDKPSPAWVGEVAPGIYGTKFTPFAQKLFSDPHQGWICYVDLRDSIAYAKTFPIYEGLTYPDGNARIAVYMDNVFVEDEVMGPVQSIPPSGGSISFTIDWFSAKVTGPIMFVNNVGAVHSPLLYINGALLGNYGVFHIGKAKVIFYDASNVKIGESAEYTVSPLKNFNINETLTMPANTASASVVIYDNQNNELGVLESRSFLQLTDVKDQKNIVKEFKLLPNYPNPFNPYTTIAWEMPVTSSVKIELFDIMGRSIRTLINETRSAGTHQVNLDGSGLSSGQYLIRIIAGKFSQTQKIVLLK